MDSIDTVEAMQTMRPEPVSARPAAVTFVRFALTGSSLPLALDTARWGDLARRAVMSIYGRRNDGGASQTLSGKNEAGRPLEGHGHAFYINVDEDGDGLLDHLTVWAPSGLDVEELETVVSVTELNPGGGRTPVQLSYQAHGDVDDLSEGCDLFGQSHRWRSLTPYVPPRHVKRRRTRDIHGRRRVVDGPRDQIAREISLRWTDGPVLVRTELQDPHEPMSPLRSGASPGFRPLEYSRHRRAGSSGGGAYNATIEFAEAVRGPVTLGFACHYGLGVFVPVTDDRSVSSAQASSTERDG